jgi:hypothetical protein
MTPKTPNVFDAAQLLKEFSFSVRKMAEEAGTDCDLPDCDALTIGTRCNNCSRRLCMGHTHWTITRAVTPYCVYCVVAMNKGLFSDDDDDDDDAEESDEAETGDSDVIDADFEEL